MLRAQIWFWWRIPPVAAGIITQTRDEYIHVGSAAAPAADGLLHNTGRHWLITQLKCKNDV